MRKESENGQFVNVEFVGSKIGTAGQIAIMGIDKDTGEKGWVWVDQNLTENVKKSFGLSSIRDGQCSCGQCEWED